MLLTHWKIEPGEPPLSVAIQNVHHEAHRLFFFVGLGIDEEAVTEDMIDDVAGYMASYGANVSFARTFVQLYNEASAVEELAAWGES